jgi:DNA-binding NtrC family response regulator
VLQEREFERLGASSTTQVDVRVIATTNRDLAREAAAGSFRQDLFYRLSGLPLEIPPLRERAEDIPLLATHFARRTAHELEKEFLGISPEALEMLRRYEWPGNVRELQHAVERAVILSSSPLLQPSAFPLHSIHGGAGGAGGPRQEAGAVNGEGWQAGGTDPAYVSFNLAEAEDRLIRGALAAAGDNRTRAAALLGISVRTLWNKLNKMEHAGAREHAEKL